MNFRHPCILGSRKFRGTGGCCCHTVTVVSRLMGVGSVLVGIETGYFSRGSHVGRRLQRGAKVVVTVIATSLDGTRRNKTKFIVFHIRVEHSWFGESRNPFDALLPSCHWSSCRRDVIVSGQTSFGLEVWFIEVPKLIIIG